MKRGGGGAWAAAGVLAAALLGAPGLRAQDEEAPAEATADAAAVSAAESSCVNEIALFCKGESGAALLDCLSAYRGSATPRCRAALRSDPGSPTVKVWASPAGVQSGGAPAKFTAPAAGAVPGGPGFDFHVSVETVTYEVAGSRRKELVDQIANAGLKDSADGDAGAAPTTAALSFNYASGPRDGGCAVASAHVRLKITQTYPKRAAAAADDAAWRRAEAAMRAHANGHQKIAVRFAQEFLGQLKSLRPVPNCAELDEAVQTLYGREPLDARAASEAYDAQTNHGQKQWSQIASGDRVKP